MRSYIVLVFVLVLTTTFIACDTHHSDLVRNLTNNQSKEWVEIDTNSTPCLNKIIFNENGKINNGFSSKSEWEFIDDGTIFLTRIDNDLGGFQERKGKIIELSETNFVIMYIENADTLVARFKCESP